ncbi:hypothetical protein [Streptomyces sp. NPDC058766]|uniref:hypothetical protein n=1 Tax=Streptomyces sp. NPDC058766 TaxID=3346630 RepID=UPI0036B7C246
MLVLEQEQEQEQERAADAGGGGVLVVGDGGPDSVVSTRCDIVTFRTREQRKSLSALWSLGSV